MSTAQPRRKAIPWRVKCEAALAKIGLTIAEVEFHHDPPLALRLWDDDAGDTVPPANDPKHIRVLLVAEHRVITTGRRGESDLSITGNGDVSRIAKVKRLTSDQEEFRRRLLSRECGEPGQRKGTIKSRGFSQGHRPLQGRRKDRHDRAS
jgi:hypothetical protein